MTRLGVYTFDEEEWTDEPEDRTYRRMGVFDLDEQEWVEVEHPTITMGPTTPGVTTPYDEEGFRKEHTTGTMRVFEPEEVPGPVVSPSSEGDGA